MWVNSETADGITSDDSTHVTVVVKPAAALSIGSLVLSLPELLGLLFFILLATIGAEFIGWRRLYVFKKKVAQNVAKTEKHVHRGVTLLKQDLEDHVEDLRQQGGRRQLTDTEQTLLESLETDIADLERYIRKDLKSLRSEKEE